jgi:hypothetical protein
MAHTVIVGRGRCRQWQEPEAVYTQAREGEEEGGRLGERREEGVGGQGGQKARPRCGARKKAPDTQDMLEEHRSCQGT